MDAHRGQGRRCLPRLIRMPVIVYFCDVRGCVSDVGDAPESGRHGGTEEGHHDLWSTEPN